MPSSGASPTLDCWGWDARRCGPREHQQTLHPRVQPQSDRAKTDWREHSAPNGGVISGFLHGRSGAFPRHYPQDLILKISGHDSGIGTHDLLYSEFRLFWLPTFLPPALKDSRSYNCSLNFRKCYFPARFTSKSICQFSSLMLFLLTRILFLRSSAFCSGA